MMVEEPGKVLFVNDFYKLWIDMHNLFIYSSTIINVEQRKDLKRTSVHITPSAIPCTATFEAASPVEVWSLWPCKSTCTEITGFYMTC